MVLTSKSSKQSQFLSAKLSVRHEEFTEVIKPDSVQAAKSQLETVLKRKVSHQWQRSGGNHLQTEKEAESGMRGKECKDNSYRGFGISAK